MKDVVGKLRKRCMQQLEENSWYTYRLIAKVMDCEGFNFDQTVNTLKMIAEIEPVKKKQMIKIIAFKEVAPVEVKESKTPNVQYTKCVRALIENSGNSAFTYEELVQLYLGNPLSYYLIKDNLDFNITITDCINSLIFGDMRRVNKTNNNFAIRKYMVKDLKSSTVREATAEEEEKIHSIIWKWVQLDNHLLPITKQDRAIEKVNSEFEDIEFVTTVFEITYTDKFLHRELYTPEIIRSEILKKWSFSIFRRYGNKPSYKEWKAKYIDPYLITETEQKGA